MAFRQMALRAVLAREYRMHKHATRKKVQFVGKKVAIFFLETALHIFWNIGIC